MGERGFAGRPTEQKILEGERPDRINHAEPAVKGEYPDPPEDLNAEAVEVWIEVKRALSGTHYVKPTDSHSLAVYCDLVARWREAERLYRTMGPVVAWNEPCGHKEGCPDECPGFFTRKYTKNPLVTVLNELAAHIRAYSREFGLSPSARASIVDPSGKGSEGDDLF